MTLACRAPSSWCASATPTFTDVYVYATLDGAPIHREGIEARTRAGADMDVDVDAEEGAEAQVKSG